MVPSDIQHLHLPSDPRVSPMGDRVAFVVSTPNLEEDRYDRLIWIADESGARPFTAGPGDTAPRWSPDGRSLAFVRAVDKKGQVGVIPADGGEATVISDFEYGVEALEWAPDGSRLLVVAVTPTEEWAELEQEERDRRPRRVRSVPFRFDNRGWTHDRRRDLWIVDPTGSEEARCLTTGDHDEELPSWSPDGSKVAFVSDRDPGQGLVSGNDVWEVDMESGEITKVTNRGFWTGVSYRPDGVLHLLGNTESRYPVDSYLYRREDDATLTDLTGGLDRSSVSLSAGPAFVRWEGNIALTGIEDSGRFGVIAVDPNGSVERVIQGDLVVTGFDSAGGSRYQTATTWDSPGELFRGDTRVSALNQEDLGLVEPEHFTVTSAGTDLDVWVYLPEGDGPVPVLLNIHGGPASQYGYGLFDEFQVYAGAGFGVVATNPRGSSGKGQAFTRSVVGDGWGVVDLEDIRIALETALDRYPRLDPGRMGVMGGSYGGFMTAWMIGQEDRWRSAVVERALTSWNSFSGTSDIGGVFPENYTGASYPDAWDTWWSMGPLALAHNVTTPTLVLHSENDFRCPIEQAEQYFMALLRNGTTAEFVRFPGEGHEMSRSGTPKHRVERFEAILDWHQRHLV